MEPNWGKNEPFFSLVKTDMNYYSRLLFTHFSSMNFKVSLSKNGGRKAKKVCQNLPDYKEEDRLSALPDYLLLHILSYLGPPTNHAAKTCVLSKRWQYLWTDLPDFDFYGSNRDINKIRDFVNWVTKTLVISNGIHLNTFKAYFYYKDRFASSLDLWFHFMIRNKVKVVELDLMPTNFDLSSTRDMYKLPQFMYFSSHVTKLCLLRCILAPPRTMNWKSLTSLTTKCMELSQSVIRIILSGCPVLEYLGLFECWGSRILDINTPSVKQLVLFNWQNHDDDDDYTLEIVAPYLHVLSIAEKGPEFRISDISSLVRAEFSFPRTSTPYFTSEDRFENVMNYVKELIGKFKHVEELELGSWFMEVLSWVTRKGWKISQLLCKRLILNACVDVRDIPGILYMLEASPNIETLIINWGCCPLDEGHDEFDLKCDLLKLRTIKFIDFGGSYRDDIPTPKLVQLLLKRAVVLEKMIIDVKLFVGRSTTVNDYSKISEMVRTYPRSSAKAVIQLS